MWMLLPECAPVAVTGFCPPSSASRAGLLPSAATSFHCPVFSARRPACARLEPPSPQQLPRSLNHRRAFVPSGPVGLAPGAPPGPALCRLLSLLSGWVFTGTFPCPPLFSLPALPLHPLLSFICHLCRRPRSPQGAHRKLRGKFSKLVALTPWLSIRTSHLFVLFFQFISERAIV